MFEHLLMNFIAVFFAGKTGLHWAASVNNIDAAIMLLHHGGLNRDAQDERGQTPLFLAAKEGSFEVAQLLLHNSANADICDQLDKLPRDIAVEKCHHDIVHLLVSYNSSLLNTSCVSATLGFPYISSAQKSKQKRTSRKHQQITKDDFGCSVYLQSHLFHHSQSEKILKRNKKKVATQSEAILYWNKMFQQKINSLLFMNNLKDCRKFYFRHLRIQIKWTRRILMILV